MSNSNPFIGKIDQTTNADKPLYFSSLGTPVYSDLTLKGGVYYDAGGNPLVLGDDIKLTNVLMTVTQAKKIIETLIQGSDGSTKEFIGMDDYHIEINGILLGSNGRYPIADVNALHQFFKAPVSINVVSTFLHNLDIYAIVVKDYKFDEEEGGYSQQNFSVSAISDAPTQIFAI